MYDLGNLSDYEFEVLCKDIAQKVYSVQLRIFTQGKDGGIDGADTKTHSAIVLQAKRYTTNSTALTNRLRELEPKIKVINPKTFLVFTSLGLTSNKHQEIVEIFKEYMTDFSYIWDAKRIDEFLHEEENIGIVRKNFKLWLSATNILNAINLQNLIIDGQVLKDSINEKKNLYVKTQFFDEAMMNLLQSHALLIIGNPGTGKTTLSEMLVLNFLSMDYEVHYSSNNNISELKKVISRDIKKKELIYIDDCLGQRYMELNYSDVTELSVLVSYIKNSENKYIILNSRITIHNEAKIQFDKYKKFIKEKANITLIDINKMSAFDKAKILYNHLYFCGIDDERFSTIRKNENYHKILNHKNYNPRLIEYITNKERYSQHKSSDYFTFVMKNLDNPKDIWADEFNNRLKPEDRILMYVLFSLTNQQINIDILKPVFENRLSLETNIDTTKNVFEDVITRLSESLIRITDNQGKIMISVTNPSINDYMSDYLKKCELECRKILQSALYFEQYIYIARDKYKSKEIIDLWTSSKLFSLKTVNNSIEYYYLRLFKENLLLNRILFDKNTFISALEKFRVDSINVKNVSKMLLDLLEITFIESYGILEEILKSGAIINVMQNLTREDCEEFGERIFKLLNEEQDLYVSFHDDLYDHLQDKYLDYVYEIVSDKLERICAKANSSIDKFDKKYNGSFGGDRRIDDICEKAEEYLGEVIDGILDSIFPVYIGNDFFLGSDMCKDRIKEYILDKIDIEDIIRKQQIDAHVDYPYYKNYREEFEKATIDNIFAKRDT